MSMSVAIQERSAPDTPRQGGGTPAIMLDGLHLAYAGRDVFRDLDLAVTPGQVYGLIGPSGGGKTTIQRAALGLLRPTGGTAYAFGEPALQLPGALRARIGYVPQQFSLYPNLTVGENLDFVAGLYGIGWIRRRRRIRDVLGVIELGEHRGKLARNLSGGMQRRLQLAAALLPQPDLLVVDEPTAGIDPILRDRFWEEFRAIAAEGRTVFFTTQYVTEAERCDYVTLVAQGSLVAEGPPAALRRLAYGGDVVDLSSPDLDWAAIQQLTQLPLVRGVERAAPGWVRLLVDDSERATPGLIRATQELGRHVDRVVCDPPSFDEVFTRLVERHA
jgi:ABC-2 type transport system ATP-binding protein